MQLVVPARPPGCAIAVRGRQASLTDHAIPEQVCLPVAHRTYHLRLPSCSESLAEWADPIPDLLALEPNELSDKITFQRSQIK